jgi:hypothetical protein
MYIVHLLFAAGHSITLTGRRGFACSRPNSI